MTGAERKEFSFKDFQDYDDGHVLAIFRSEDAVQRMKDDSVQLTACALFGLLEHRGIQDPLGRYSERNRAPARVFRIPWTAQKLCSGHFGMDSSGLQNERFPLEGVFAASFNEIEMKGS